MLLEKALQAIEDLPVPTVAVVEGVATGAGCQLALACDLQLMNGSARIGMPIARLGLLVPATFANRMSLRIGPSRTKDLLYGGRLLTAEQAGAIRPGEHGSARRRRGAASARLLAWVGRDFRQPRCGRPRPRWIRVSGRRPNRRGTWPQARRPIRTNLPAGCTASCTAKDLGTNRWSSLSRTGGRPSELCERGDRGARVAEVSARPWPASVDHRCLVGLVGTPVVDRASFTSARRPRCAGCGGLCAAVAGLRRPPVSLVEDRGVDGGVDATGSTSGRARRACREPGRYEPRGSGGESSGRPG